MDTHAWVAMWGSMTPSQGPYVAPARPSVATGDVPSRFVGGQHLHRGAEAALQRDRIQVPVPAVVGHQKEVTDVPVADLEAVPLAELAVDGQGVHGELDVGPCGELDPHPGRAATGGAERGGALPFEDGDAQAALGEVVRARGPDDSGADDDDVGGVAQLRERPCGQERGTCAQRFKNATLPSISACRDSHLAVGADFETEELVLAGDVAPAAAEGVVVPMLEGALEAGPEGGAEHPGVLGQP